MASPSIVEPEPEPDIEGHNPQQQIHTNTTASSGYLSTTGDTTSQQQQHVLSEPEPGSSAPALKQSTTLRTILKPRSRPGHARAPSIKISEADPVSHDTAGLPSRPNSAPTISVGGNSGSAFGRNRLAPLKNISIPLPPKMGPPEIEEEKVQKTFMEPTWKQCFRVSHIFCSSDGRTNDNDDNEEHHQGSTCPCCGADHSSHQLGIAF